MKNKSVNKFMNKNAINFKNWLENYELLREFDKDLFKDVPYRCISHEKIAELLNNQLKRYEDNESLSANKREPFKKGGELPQISKGNLIKIKVDDSIVNVEEFARLITTPPKTIFDEGEKSIHSNELDKNSHTVNTGLSALRSIIYSETDNKFYSINTCPGAGSCVIDCYALKGFYISTDGKNLKLIQRVNYLMNHPEKYQKQALDELLAVASVVVPNNKTLNIRWNDAGDFFSDVYLNIAINVTKKLKSIHISDTDLNDDFLKIHNYKPKKTTTFGDKIHSYAYTKMHKRYEIGEKHGMTMNFSIEAKPSEIEKFGEKLEKTKLSIIVPREVFSGIFEKPKRDVPPIFKSNMNYNDLKNIIWEWIKRENIDKKYKISKQSLLFTKDLIGKKGKPKEFNVITLQKDSDIGAQRKDVKINFLLEH